MEQTIEKLLHKEFEQKLRGYDKDQVDDFLDEVIEDIETLQNKHNLLLDEKKILEKNNFELKMKMLSMKEKLESKDLNSQTSYLGQTKIVSDAFKNDEPKIVKAPVQEHTITINKPQQNVDPAVKSEPMLSEPITHEDAKANDHTLQDRIEQLEKELNNIKNFTD